MGLTGKAFELLRSFFLPQMGIFMGFCTSRNGAILVFATGILFAPNLNAQQTARTDLLYPGGTFDEFIVKYKDGSPERANSAALRKSLDKAAAKATLRAGHSISATRLAASAGASDLIRATRKLDRIDAADYMREIASNPNVEYVEPNAKAQVLSTVPNDPDYSSQWYYSDPIGGINAPNAWTSSQGQLTSGAAVVIAVIDSGKTAHSDLDAKMLPGYDFIVDSTIAKDGNGRDADPSDPGIYRIYAGDDPCVGPYECSNLTLGVLYSDWHGTMVSGIAAAGTNNASGIAGTGFNAKILPIRVVGRGGVASPADVAAAIQWAAGIPVDGVSNPNPAKVINLSLGFYASTPTECGPTLQAAVNSAVAAGATVVAAAGNDEGAHFRQPATCANVISVASTTRSGTRSTYTSYGSNVDIAAPGGDGSDLIYTTSNTGTNQPVAQTYAYAAGTSMSTPQVAGTVALMQAMAMDSCSRWLTPAEVESRLLSSARPFPVTPTQYIGVGILNANEAVASAKCRVTGGPLPPLPGTG
jgi:serine protease